MAKQKCFHLFKDIDEFFNQGTTSVSFSVEKALPYRPWDDQVGDNVAEEFDSDHAAAVSALAACFERLASLDDQIPSPLDLKNNMDIGSILSEIDYCLA